GRRRVSVLGSAEPRSAAAANGAQLLPRRGRQSYVQLRFDLPALQLVAGIDPPTAGDLAGGLRYSPITRSALSSALCLGQVWSLKTQRSGAWHVAHRLFFSQRPE